MQQNTSQLGEFGQVIPNYNIQYNQNDSYVCDQSSQVKTQLNLSSGGT
jgi:hypothetical protein